MSWRGLFAGSLALCAFEVVVSSQQSGQRFGELLTSMGAVVDHFLDPTVPAIPWIPN